MSMAASIIGANDVGPTHILIQEITYLALYPK
jgi:hypothetical protein